MVEIGDALRGQPVCNSNACRPALSVRAGFAKTECVAKKYMRSHGRMRRIDELYLQ